MIFGNMDHVEEFPYLEKGIKECFEYAKTHDLASLKKEVTRLMEIAFL